MDPRPFEVLANDLHTIFIQRGEVVELVSSDRVTKAPKILPGKGLRTQSIIIGYRSQNYSRSQVAGTIPPRTSRAVKWCLRI